jgi:hypothetical protein
LQENKEKMELVKFGPFLLEELVSNYSNCQQIMGSLLFVGIDVLIPSTQKSGFIFPV